MQRVNVYRLNEDGRWDEQGTGYVTVDYLESDLGLVVLDEDNKTLLSHRITSHDIYHKQEDTAISLRDPDFSTELVLSFQATTGCSYIWDQICSAQRNLHFSCSLTNDRYHNVNMESRELPPVKLSTLPLILKIVFESHVTDRLSLTELILHDQDFFCNLMELFRRCEDLENVDALTLIFKIIRVVILLNSPQIFQKIFGDDLIMDIIGCLEYDPWVPQIHHRSILKEHVVYKEAIPIKNPIVLSKIHQTYRVGYVKDVILPGALDEAIVANLNSVIHSNNATVVSLLRDDNTFTKQLFARLKSPTTSIESKKTLVHFLHEFCTLSKSLQMAHQLQLFRDLADEGIFDIIADVLQSEDKKLVLTATDILVLFLNQDADILHSYLTRQEGDLFGLLVKNMITDSGDDMHCQFLEILRHLLELHMPGAPREAVVEIFYEKYFGELVDVITSSCPPKCDGQVGCESLRSDGVSINQKHVKPEILLNICDLLCFCVLHHTCRLKCSFRLNNVIDKVLYLTRRREKYLVVAAVRFMRSLVSRSDELLMNHIVKSNLLKPIVDAFVANGDRYNLLNSAVLELFEYIRKENLKILLRYLIDTFWDQLARFENLSSIHALIVKYEQPLESVGARSSGSLFDQRKPIDERSLEKEEEEYFNEGRDKEDSAFTHSTNRGQSQPPVLANGFSTNDPSSMSGRLADYDDEKENEDCRPPPKQLTNVSVEDEEVAEFWLKRKTASNALPEPKRLQRFPKCLKPKGVFAAFCPTLNQAVLPSKKAVTNLKDKCSISSSGEARNTEVGNLTVNEEKSPPTSCLNDAADNKQQEEECTLLLPKSSTEMAVNGPCVFISNA